MEYISDENYKLSINGTEVITNIKELQENIDKINKYNRYTDIDDVRLDKTDLIYIIKNLLYWTEHDRNEEDITSDILYEILDGMDLIV